VHEFFTSAEKFVHLRKFPVVLNSKHSVGAHEQSIRKQLRGATAPLDEHLFHSTFGREDANAYIKTPCCCVVAVGSNICRTI
jgi:hypothetical protein